MAKQVNIDEMLEVLTGLEHPQLPGLIGALESVATHMADLIAQSLGCRVEAATWERLAFGGLCAPIGPRQAGDPVPDALSEIDPGADWEL